MKFFTIERIKEACNHLEKYHSGSVIVPLVLAVNGINKRAFSRGTAGTDNGFLRDHFHGHLIGLCPVDMKCNLRPKFREIQIPDNDYVSFGKQQLWANLYSQRAFGHLKARSLVSTQGKSTNTEIKLENGFKENFERELEEDFHFEELLIWLYAFSGFPDSVNSWQDLLLIFQESYLGIGKLFEEEYLGRFNVHNGVVWPTVLLNERPTDESFQQELFPSKKVLGDNTDVTDLSCESANEVKPEIANDRGSECVNNKQTPPTRYPRKTTRYPMNIILYGAPGTGKTYATTEYALAIIENKGISDKTLSKDKRKALVDAYKEKIKTGQIIFTTFHQNYGYEDFIQGLRPDRDADTMKFRPIDGVFKRMADDAIKDNEKNYVIVIDEINRANISKVFGELITLIETDKRWGEANELCVTLPSGDIFAIPNNLYILGTMNSADKSISLIDTALRRRFDFIEIAPDAELVTDPVLKKVLIALNDKLYDELDSTDLLVGHAYFIEKKEDDLINIMNRNIIPLLYEYFFDNRKKVKAVVDKALDGLNYTVLSEKVGRLKVVKKD